MKLKIKKGDQVIVVAGANRGHKGAVLRALPSESKVVIDGTNMKKRRERPRKQGEKGQVVEAAYPINVSNVMLWCQKCGKGARIAYDSSSGKKVRVCHRCGKNI